MNREEFFVRLAPLDAEQRGKILWNLYWRGTAAVRERIEGELAAGAGAAQARCRRTAGSGVRARGGLPVC